MEAGRFAPYGERDRGMVMGGGGRVAGVPKGPRPGQAPKDKTPCKFYAQGTCTKGPECEWMHITPATPSANMMPMMAAISAAGGVQGGKGRTAGLAPKSQVPCKYLAAGKCDRGTSCEWFHPPANMDPYAAAAAFGMPGRSGGVADYELQQFTGLAQQLLVASPQLSAASMMAASAMTSPGAPKSSVICRYYASGKCDKGTMCEWQHPGYVQGSDQPPAQRPRDANVPLPPKNEVPCRYMSRGICTRGESCEWKHSITE